MTRKEREELLGALVTLLALAMGGAIVSTLAGETVVPVAAVLVMAFAKGRLIILDFMEFRGSRSILRAMLIAWPCVLLTAALARSIAVDLF